MPIDILMPALSPTMTEGRLARWLKAEGDAIKSGDVIAEIETDKATMEFEAVDEGVLGRILVPGGTAGVAVNTPIGVILEEGEDASAIPAAPAPAAVKATAAAVPVAAGHRGERVFATPLARRIARDAGLDLKALSGSGPHGRIVKHDVEAALAAGPVKPAVAATVPVPGQAYTDVPLSTMRKVIAQRLTEAKRSVPHFYLGIDCRLDRLLALRAEINGSGGDYKLSVNDFIIRAAALALKKVPAANASFTGTAIRFYADADISVAVATPSGLITPIVRQADRKGLGVISEEMKILAAKAKDGKLKPEEFQGGTFTISNLGMFGVKEFSAIINPPQGCILAVGAGEQRPVVRDGILAVATVMTCTLSADHRVVDGAVGAEFMAAFRKLIEEPLTMLL